jgi:hypothetical protein
VLAHSHRELNNLREARSALNCRGHNPLLLFIRHVPLKKMRRTPPNSPTSTNTKKVNFDSINRVYRRLTFFQAVRHSHPSREFGL